MNKTAKVLIAALLALVGVGGITAVTYFVSKKHGITIEADLSKHYDKDRAKLGECIDNALTAAGYTKAQAQSMENALIAAAGGDGLMGASASPAGFSAIITKQYPNLAPFDAAFQRGFNQTVGCRKDFTQLQNVLIDKIADFRKWKNNPFTVANWFGTWPNDALEVKDPTTNKLISGAPAWELVTTIITNSAANSAYSNGGNYNAPDPFATPTTGNGSSPAPAASPSGNVGPLPAGSPSGR